MTTTTTNTDELRQQLHAAQQQQKALAAEHAGIDQQIQEAMKRVAREKAQAARQGEGVVHVSAELDVEDLRRRRDELPFALWAQRLTVAELARDLHQAELAEAEDESDRTGEEYDVAQRELALAEKRHADAYTRHSGAGARVNRLRAAIREDLRTLQSLEEAPPRV